MISVVVAAKEAERTLAPAIESALQQEVDVPFEVIVVDDGSVDGTGEVARSFGDRLTVISFERNRGRSAARNAAVDAAAGAIVVPFDADDRMLPGRLAAHLRAFEGHPEASVVFGRSLGVHPGGVRPWPLMPSTPAEVDAWFRRGRMAVNHPACAFRREWFDALGGYDEDVRVAEDFDLFLRGRTDGAYVPHDDVVIEYRIDGRFPSWGYWWDNERHRRAIVARAAHAARPFAAHLHRASRPAVRLMEALRWAGAAVRDRVTG